YSTAPAARHTLSLHDALPISSTFSRASELMPVKSPLPPLMGLALLVTSCGTLDQPWVNPDHCANREGDAFCAQRHPGGDLPYCSDRKSTRLNSSHVKISYAVF